MSNFSIDDVRETFTVDVTSFLGLIEESAQQLLAGASLEDPSGRLVGGRPVFEVIGEFGHAVTGTTALVQADSLTESSRLVEELARQGHEALLDLDRSAARARHAARLCYEGARRMRTMLELELGHRASQALWESLDWRESVVADPDSGASKPPEERLDADLPAEEASRPPAPASVSSELREVFDVEAGEVLSSLETELRALAADPTAPTTVANLERLFHTLKGAAATVGLTEVSRLAANLQVLMESAVESSTPLTPEVSGGLVADVNRMLRTAELPELCIDSSAPAPSVEAAPGEFDFSEESPAQARIGLELRQVFDEEARDVLESLQQAFAALSANPEDLAAANALERLFHTLKGAAATVGLATVSRLATLLQERMERLIESGAAVSQELREQLLSDVSEMLRIADLPDINLDPAEVEAPALTPVQEAHQSFLLEARTALDEVAAALKILSGGDSDQDSEARAQLRRLYHRLKGSAHIVGETALGEESERLQLLLEGDPSTSDVTAESAKWLALVNATIAQAVAGAPTHERETTRRREPVQLVVNAELWDAFLQECNELVESIDREVLALEASDQPKLALEALMRYFHTLKGVLNTVGLKPSGEMIHRVEDLLERLIQSAILPPMRSLSTFLIEVQGDVRRHLRQAQGGYVETDVARLEARIARLLGRPRAAGEEPTGASLIGMTAGERTAGRGTETGASLHSIHSARSLASQRSDRGRGESDRSQDDALGRRYIRVAADRLDALMNLAGELVVSRSRLLTRVGSLRALQQEMSSGNRRLLETVEGFSGEYEFANLQGEARDGKAAKARGPADSQGDPSWKDFGELELDQYNDIHVLSRRLVEVTNDFDELNGQLGRNLAAFNDDSDVFGRIVSGIQGEVTRARMVPLEQLFTRLQFPIRDAATREGKEMRVAVEGSDVQIDKTIADALLQPMLHLVRNSAGHGIESAATRDRAGKPAMGVIALRARQESGQIVIEVGDDGAGLDLERLRARGAAMGLVAADIPLSDLAVRELVFAAGLSTRAQAGAVSGRGIGCDVVRRSVERLNGAIRVDSIPGRGTTFVITLPVTLAITKALIVRHGDRTYAIPLHFAERIIDAQEEALIHSAGVHRIKVGDSFLSVGRLEQHFQSSAQTSAHGPVLLLRVGAARTVLQVDAVIGQEEVVVKSLGDVLSGHPVFAGVTIRGTGELVLIIDVPGLLEERAHRIGEARDRRPVVRRSSPAYPEAKEGERSAGNEEGDLAPAISVEVAAPERPLRVLFVDDSLSVRKFAQLTLMALGVEVTLAVDGVDGLAKLRSGSFDLVFTDLEMPRMHGFELIRELRFLPIYRDLPIVVVTSRSSTKHQQQARELGATEYLTKPFTAQSVEEVLKTWGKRRDAATHPELALASPAVGAKLPTERKPS